MELSKLGKLAGLARSVVASELFQDSTLPIRCKLLSEDDVVGGGKKTLYIVSTEGGHKPSLVNDEGVIVLYTKCFDYCVEYSKAVNLVLALLSIENIEDFRMWLIKTEYNPSHLKNDPVYDILYAYLKDRYLDV